MPRMDDHEVRFVITRSGYDVTASEALAMARDLLDARLEVERLKPKDSEYEALYKEWKQKNEACNQAYAITIPRLAKERDKARAECAKLREQLREGCTCGSGAHPRPCKRHPEAYEVHVEALNTEAALERLRDVLIEAREYVRAHSAVMLLKKIDAALNATKEAMTDSHPRIVCEKCGVDLEHPATVAMSIDDAMQRVEKAEAECDALRAALTKIAKIDGLCSAACDNDDCEGCSRRGWVAEIARDALAFDATKDKP